MSVTVLPAGDRAVLVEPAAGHSAVHAIADAARAVFGAQLTDVVAGHETVLLVFSAQAPPIGAIRDACHVSFSRSATESPRAREVEIAVRYDGADLADVAAHAGVSPEEVVARHVAASYEVAFCGFMPGFAYLLGGDPLLAVPRLDAPRQSVPAGSVALGGPYSAVYPRESPGGWRLIGTTGAVLFDQERERPALLEPGMTVRFTREPRA